MTTKTKQHPYLSGFCNRTNPPDSHERCPLEYNGEPFSCLCHMAPATNLTTEERTGQDELGSQVLGSHHGDVPDDPRGFYASIDEEKYHAHAGSLSHSGAKVILRAPALFQWQKAHPVYKTTFDFGSAAHAMVLGVGAELVVHEYDATKVKSPKATNAWKEQQEEVRARPNSVLLLPDEYAHVQDMADQLSSHRKAMELLSIGEPEVSAFALDEETGVLMRCRYDWRRPRIGVDYKTTVAGGAQPDEFVRTAHKLGYHGQQDWYCHVAEILGEPLQGFGFIVQEKEPPYLVTVIELPAELVELGRDRNRLARQMFRDCTESGHWPAYVPDDQIATPQAPDWILRKAAS